MTTPPPEPGVSFSFAAALQAADENYAKRIAQDRLEEERRLAQLVHPFTVPPVLMTISAGAGSYYQPNLTGPQLGNYWDMRRVSATGFTAGTVTVYMNQSGAEIIAIFSAAGVLLNGKGQMMLTGNDNMYFAATGITLAAGAGGVTLSWAGIEVASPAIGRYLL